MDFKSRNRFRFRNSMMILGLLSFILSSFVSPAFSQEKPPVQVKPTAQRTDREGPIAFGYDIFRETKEPVTDGPIDDQYILSPGDEVIVRAWGQLNLNYPLTVSEEGFIEIPDGGGRIYTNGLSLRDLRARVNKNLSGIYAAYINLDNPAQSTAFTEVKLGKVRKLLVYVVGEVKNQGGYTVSAGAATLLNLLNNAGGILTTGSLRQIMIRRADGSIDTIDLYDFLITGKIDSRKAQIRAGDYIIVPPKKKSVTVLGEIKRQGIYETIGSEGIRDLVRFAGGLTPKAILKRAQVRRLEIDKGEKVLDVNIDGIISGAEKDFVLNDGDEVTFFPAIIVRRRIVEAQGNGIKRPGTYEFVPGMRVGDLIAQAEGLKEDVYLDRADFIRTNDDFSTNLRIFSLKGLYELGAPGQYKFIGTADANFELRELDEIVIYSAGEFRGKDKTITIEGQVKQPGIFALAENLNLFDLVFSRGGFQDRDFRKTAYLELAHVYRKIPGDQGEKLIPFNLGKLLDGDAAENMKLESEDRVVIYSFDTFRAKPMVTIKGLIKKPGDYPLIQDMTLEDLVLAAGGLSLDAFNVEAVIARSSRYQGSAGALPQDSSITVPLPVDYAERPAGKKTKLEVFDKILVRNLPGWEPGAVSSIEGEVLNPGDYSLPKGDDKITSLVRKAGGLKPDALPEGAVLSRRRDFIQMTRKSQQTTESQSEYERVAIDLKGALENPGGPSDIVLKDGDRLYVPTNPGTVEVKGAVGRPAVLQHKSGESLDYYIGQCGGYLKAADRNETVISLPNGAAVKKGRGIIFASNPRIPAGSVIEVPFKEAPGATETKVIEIRGGVKFPLAVQYKMGEKLEYYVRMCGGYLDDADIGNVTIVAPDGETVSAEGLVPFNPIVKPGSIIEIPVRETGKTAGAATVGIRGAVKTPRIAPYKKGEKLDYYIRLCGGYRDDADIGALTITYQDEKTISGKAVALSNPVIEPGCIIDVPVKK